MNIRHAFLVPGTETPTRDGIHGAKHCVIQTQDKTMLRAVIKHGTQYDILIECYCAVVLDAWGLRVPDPYLIDTNDGVAFASADVGYPNLKHRIGNLHAVSDGEFAEIIKYLAELVAQFKSTPLAIAADQAIDNRDRNVENILWDGTEVYWIDHAASLGNAPSAMAECNKLAQLVLASTEREAIGRSAVAQSMVLDRDVPDIANHEVERQFGACELSAYINDRLPGIAARLSTMFVIAPDLLSGLPPS